MAKKDLNKVFDYTLLGETFVPIKATQKKISSHTIQDKDDWEAAKFNQFKKEFKKHYVIKQKTRCAICRVKIQADGHYEDIDHIIPRSKRKNWMFETKNLICTCTACNRLKRASNTLSKRYNRKKKIPDKKSAFLVFNPHYDTWSDHFLIEDGIFLVAKPYSKGSTTINVYQLDRYQVCINLSNEKDNPNYKKDARKVLKRLYVTKNKKEKARLNAIKKEYDYYLQ